MTEHKILSLSENEKLDYIKNKYIKYINDRNCVYYLLHDKWLIIMRNIFGTKKNDNGQYVQYKITKNNEGRTDVIDPLYAVFRANILQVCAIVDIETFNEEVICYDDYDEKIVVYEVGQFVESYNYDINPNNVHSCGIYYYKSIERAFLDRRRIVRGSTARLMRWYDNGRKMAEEIFIDGKREGIWSEFGQNGIKCIEEVYLHGENYGKWSCWYESGKIAWTKEYQDDGKKYKFISWYEDNGKKESEGNYIINEKNCLDHKQDGVWTYWDINGNKTTEHYVNGVKQNIEQPHS